MCATNKYSIHHMKIRSGSKLVACPLQFIPSKIFERKSFFVTSNSTRLVTTNHQARVIYRKCTGTKPLPITGVVLALKHFRSLTGLVVALKHFR